MNPLMNPVGSNAEGKLNCINAVVITQKIGKHRQMLADFFTSEVFGLVVRKIAKSPPCITVDFFMYTKPPERSRRFSHNPQCRG